MNSSPRLTPRSRILAAVAGLALVAPAVVATRLTPDARGWGTHEQLGWAPCRWRQWTGRPCPTCGMTTAWALAVRGQIGAAVAANLGGTVLLGAALATAAYAAAGAATGRRLFARPNLRWTLGFGTAWLIVTLLDWVQRLAAG